MKPKKKDLRLNDIGEFELLNNYILPLLKSSEKLIGDDCAFIGFPKHGKSLVITTDAGPKPIFFSEEFPYYYIWGWYTILANVSDLASAGCYPLAISLGIEANSEMKLSELMDFFTGIKHASKKFGIPVSGGNIKSNKIFISNATAFGYLRKNQKRLTRNNCKPGDLAISIGEQAKFIVSYLKFEKEGLTKLDRWQKARLSEPLAQLKQMQILNKNLDITSASDNSDGVLGSLWNIAEKSNCAFILDLDNIPLPDFIIEFSKENGINPWNLFFFWGDWQVIITLNPKELQVFKQRCKDYKIKYTILGKAREGRPELYALHEGEHKILNLLRNENFSNLSYNEHIKNHIDYLLKENIFKN